MIILTRVIGELTGYWVDLGTGLIVGVGLVIKLKLWADVGLGKGVGLFMGLVSIRLDIFYLSVVII